MIHFCHLLVLHESVLGLQTPATGSERPPVKTFEHSVCGKRNTGGVGFRITGADDVRMGI